MSYGGRHTLTSLQQTARVKAKAKSHTLATDGKNRDDNLPLSDGEPRSKHFVALLHFLLQFLISLLSTSTYHRWSYLGQKDYGQKKDRPDCQKMQAKLPAKKPFFSLPVLHPVDSTSYL